MRGRAGYAERVSERSGLSDLRLWWVKWRWYQRGALPWNRLALHRELARRRAFAKWPLNGEPLELLREGRLEIGEGTLLERGVWLTAGDAGRIRIGSGVFLNQGVMVAATGLVEIGDHCMAANGCFITDANHRFDDADQAGHLAGLRQPRADAARGQRLARGQRRRHQRRHDRRAKRDRRQQRRHLGHPGGIDRRRCAGARDARDRLPRRRAGSGSRDGSRAETPRRYLSTTTATASTANPANAAKASTARTVHGTTAALCPSRLASDARIVADEREREAQRDADRDAESLPGQRQQLLPDRFRGERDHASPTAGIGRDAERRRGSRRPARSR